MITQMLGCAEVRVKPAPSDDINQPVDFAAAAKYVEIVRALLIDIANGDHRPEWKPDSFFRRYAEPAKMGQ